MGVTTNGTELYAKGPPPLGSGGRLRATNAREPQVGLLASADVTVVQCFRTSEPTPAHVDEPSTRLVSNHPPCNASGDRVALSKAAVLGPARNGDADDTAVPIDHGPAA